MSNKALSRFHQPISVPGRRLMHHIPLKFVTKKVTGGGGKAMNHEIPLIPFIDFLLCIVLFLLASFSASGELPIDKSITLPSAENVEDMKEAPIVAITGTQILVDGISAGSTRPIEDANRLQKVEQLFDILKAKRDLWTQVNPGKEFPGIALLQVDEKVPALIVKSVFQTAAFAGFPNVSFMVRRRAGSE
jgi:biopolymer transport protein ExbD